MRHRLLWKLGSVILICALVLGVSAPSGGVTKIIVVPTARTIGARHYALELNRKAPLLDEQARNLDMTLKVGLGPRFMFDAKYPLQQRGSSATLLYGKYTFATANRGLTAAAIGIDNVGAGSRATSYVVLSHLSDPADITVGVAQGTDMVVQYLAGIDYRAGGRLHLLSDWNSGTGSFASAGFQYQFASRWTLKSGVEFVRDGGSTLLVKIAYNGEY